METTIDLWIWDLDAPRDPAPILSTDEQARADRFVHQIHADRFVNGRAKLREIMGSYLAMPPDQLEFTYGPNGKPALPGPFAFNLSHTKNTAALAVTKNAELGLDIQKHRFVEPDVATRFFSSAEIAELSALPQNQWQQGFYRCWTRKEAMVKAVGTGLSLDLASFDVSLTPGQPAILRRFAPDPGAVENWSLLHLDLAPDIPGAIAVKNHKRPVKLVRK